MNRKTVVHLGPKNSKGGMAVVMFNLMDDYDAVAINTHLDGSLRVKISTWINARKELRRILDERNVRIIHVHVTHSISWWRKMNLIRICEKRSLPIIIHIHSGRFDVFCQSMFGFCGYLVKNKLKNNSLKVVLLEKRWLKILKKWIPRNAIVIPNHSESRVFNDGNFNNEEIQILMLSRKSKGKGHNFSIKIAEYLDEKNIKFKLIMTGIEKNDLKNNMNGAIDAKGWISNNQKNDLISKSDFLIMPSEFEGSSMSVIESIVNGLPCLVSHASSDTVGIEELTLPLNDPAEWGERIIYLSNYERYTSVRKKLEIRALSFSKDKNKEYISKLYDDIG